MDSDNFLLSVAIIAVLVSLVGVSITYSSVNAFENLLSGYIVESGQVNLTVSSSVVINITSSNNYEGQKNISFGTGTVDGGAQFAELITNGTNVDSTGFDIVDKGFNVRNIGNVNVTVNISSDLNAQDFIGGATPLFQYNVSNNGTLGCVDYPASTEGVYKEFVTTAGGVRACNNFTFASGTAESEMRLDLYLKLPKNSNTGSLGNTIHLTYFEADGTVF